MLDDVHIWAAGRPIEFIEFLLLEPVLSKAGSVLWIIVLLEIDILFVDIQVPQGPQEIVVKDLDIEFRVHIALDATNSTQALGCDTAPDHDVPTTVLYLLSDISLVKFLPWFPPTIATPVRPKNIKF